jgi:tetratricopeptide (TPR) repeat protein
MAVLAPAIIWTVRAHPNQYVYFNETVGGLKGAYGYYETDYYQNSGLQAADWLKRHIKERKGKKIIVRSNMAGFEQYFAGDTSWLNYSYGRYEERNQYDWDYYITYSRYIMPELLQDDKWPPGGAVYKVVLDDVPLSVILARKSKDGIKAYNAYKNKDFTTAVQYYTNLVKQDSTDPYVYLYYGISLGQGADIESIDKGIACLDRATQLQPGNPQFYNELSKLYRQEGDLYNEQKAKDMANSLVIRNGD